VLVLTRRRAKSQCVLLFSHYCKFSNCPFLSAVTLSPFAAIDARSPGSNNFFAPFLDRTPNPFAYAKHIFSFHGLTDHKRALVYFSEGRTGGHPLFFFSRLMFSATCPRRVSNSTPGYPRQLSFSLPLCVRSND